MIRTFRKFTIQFIGQGKARRYLAYALGEILLIMIGVIFALQINNWNENRKARDEEQKFLIQLKEDFQQDLRQLREKENLTLMVLESVNDFLELIDDEGTPKMDSTDLYFAKLLAAPTFDPVTAYLSASENLSLISDAELKRRLSTWNSDYTQLLDAELTWKNFRDDYMFNYLIPRYPLRNMYDYFWQNTRIKRGLLDDPKDGYAFQLKRSSRQQGNPGIWKDDDFEDYLSHIFTLNRIAFLQINALEKRILDILGLIEKRMQ